MKAKVWDEKNGDGKAKKSIIFEEVEVKKYNLWVILVLRECETSDTIHINQYQASQHWK